MLRQVYPGQYKFRIIRSDQERSAKQRANAQLRMLNLRERHRQEQQENNADKSISARNF